MAEAIVNTQLSENWQAFSAGTKPAGYIHPIAIEVLSEIGIHHQGTSKHADDFRHINFDVVITVCDSAAEECPVWLGKGSRIHKSFRDPASAIGTDEEIMQVFRDVRDNIAEIIPKVLHKWEQEYKLQNSYNGDV
jgi:arsenate reductase